MRRALIALGLLTALGAFGVVTHQLRKPTPTGAALGVADPMNDITPVGLEVLPRGVVEGRFAVRGPDGWQVIDAADIDQAMREVPGAKDAEPLVYTHASGSPNDPRYPHQWNLHVLDMPSAWDSSQGQGVVVAVLDTGVSQQLDGYVDLLDGWDVTSGRPGAEDDGWHGTHVAAVIAQSTNNNEGVASVAPQATLLPVKVLDAYGGGNSVDLANGIRWAVDHGADIINLSLGLDQPSTPVQEACEYAWNEGVLVVAATGNDGLRSVQYPAAYDTVIAVAAVDLNLDLTDYSNVGPEVDLVAPGGDLDADLDGDGLADGVMQAARFDGEWQYLLAEGTSVATPHVSAVAALVMANGVTDPEQVRQRLLDSAEDLGSPGHDAETGWGLVDPVAALKDTPASVDAESQFTSSWSSVPEGPTEPFGGTPRGCNSGG